MKKSSRVWVGLYITVVVLLLVVVEGEVAKADAISSSSSSSSRSMRVCNGTIGDCLSQSLEDEEFSMDSHFSRRILAGYSTPTGNVLKQPPLCNVNDGYKTCPGLETSQKRQDPRIKRDSSS